MSDPPAAPADPAQLARADEQRAHGRAGMMGSVYVVSFFTLLSRISGLLRESTNAYFLGTGMAADAFRIALIIPNVLRRLVGEGAISSAFVPVYARAVQTDDPAQVHLFAQKFFTFWLLVLTVVTVGGMVLAGWALVSLQTGGTAWSPEKLALTASLTRWLFPYVFLIGLSAVAAGILNAHGVFGLPSVTPLLYNLAFVAAGYLLAPFFPGEQAAYSLSIGVLAGGALQLLILIPPLRRMGLRLRLSWPGGHPGVREVLRLLIPGTFGAGVYQLNILVSSILAMAIPEHGAVAALGYAGRLMEFVLGVFVFALSTVSLTTLSRQIASGNSEGFRGTLAEVIRLTAFITLPSTAGLFILRGPIVSVLLQYGQFNEESARLTAGAFQYYIPGLFLIGLSRVLVVAFYAIKDTWTPVRVAAANLVLNAASCWLLMAPLGHAGIALASTIAALAQSAWLFWAFARKQPHLLALGDIGRSLLRSLAATLAMGAVCMGLRGWLLTETHGKLRLSLGLGAVIATGVAVYFLFARLLGSAEVATLLRGVTRRRRR